MSAHPELARGKNTCNLVAWQLCNLSRGLCNIPKHVSLIMSQLNMAVLLQITILFLSAIPSGTAAPLKEEVQANLITVTPTSANLTGTLTEVEDPEESDGDFKKSVHLSTALAGMVLLLFLQVHIRSHGYRLGRAFWTSSDNLMWVGMGVVSGLWTLLVFLSAWEWEHQGTTPCRTDPAGWKCAGRLAFVPWILDGVFWWWVLRYLWHRCRRNFKCLSWNISLVDLFQLTCSQTEMALHSTRRECSLGFARWSRSITGQSPSRYIFSS